MRVSRSTGYAILGVGYIARKKDEKIILSQSISKEYGIPLEYLLKILQQLVRANILRSKRGPRGGFSLAQPLNKILLLQIFEAVDGPMPDSLDLQEFAPNEKFGKNAEIAYKKGVAQARAVFDKTKVAALL